jgi:hypothetical protein
VGFLWLMSKFLVRAAGFLQGFAGSFDWSPWPICGTHLWYTKYELVVRNPLLCWTFGVSKFGGGESHSLRQSIARIAANSRRPVVSADCPRQFAASVISAMIAASAVVASLIATGAIPTAPSYRRTGRRAMGTGFAKGRDDRAGPPRATAQMLRLMADETIRDDGRGQGFRERARQA